MLHRRKQIFAWWLERGFALLPAQPGTKYLRAGWGEHQKKIIRQIDAEAVIHVNDNFAVLGDDSKIILDFDNPSLYEKWVHEHEHIAMTYTERTPRGGAHVFFVGAAPKGIKLIAGVELKKVCLVAPSIVFKKQYTRGEGEILEADPTQIFSSLSEIGTSSAYRLQASQNRKVNSDRPGLIEQIKQHWTVEHVFALYHPEIELRDKGKVIACRCPFHEDHRPSFYILPELGIWGCHACAIRGDVINLYARFEGISNREAISRMSQRLGAK